MTNNEFIIGKWLFGKVTLTLADREKKIITRRDFIKGLILGTTVLVFSPRPLLSATASENDSLRNFRWRLPTAHFETVKKELRFEGEITEEKDAKGLPLVYIFVGAVLLLYLAKAILAVRREIVYGGVLIDTRGKEIVIDTNKSLSAGVIVIVTPEGTQLYERDEINDPAELIKILRRRH